MAYIRIKQNTFPEAISGIEEYLRCLNDQMALCQNSAVELSECWEGTDQAEFLRKWNQLVDNKSMYYNMVKALDNYKNYLDFAQKEYKGAQNRAIIRAHDLHML